MRPPRLISASGETSTPFRRVSAGELVQEGWHLDRNLSFATAAIVSSLPGAAARGGKSHPCPALIGGPSVFPYHGGAGTVWLVHPDDRRPTATVTFSANKPATAIRIFETLRPSAILNVRATTQAGHQLDLYAAPAHRVGAPNAVAVALEIALPAPATIMSITLTLDPADAGPTAIDAVALIHAVPVAPPGTNWLAGRRRRSLALTVLTHAAIALPLIAIALLTLGGADALPPARRAEAAQAVSTPWEALTPASIRWASGAAEGSTLPAIVGYEATYALGPPDAGRPPRDAPQTTWSPPQDGLYHRDLARLSVTFDPPCDAAALVLVEAFGSGALRAIDVGSDAQDLVRVFHTGPGLGPEIYAGPRTFPEGGVRARYDEVLVFSFAYPLTVTHAVLHFDPRQVPGTVAIDAVGLIPVDAAAPRPKVPE